MHEEAHKRASKPCCCPADVQAYLNGVDSPAFKNFFTVKTFIAKVIGSALAVGSSLVMGKEGPMLHAGSILAVIMGERELHACRGQHKGAAQGGPTHNPQPAHDNKGPCCMR